MTELADILWRDIAEANLEHDAPHERRLCDELRAMPVIVPRQPLELHVTQDERRGTQRH